MARASCLLVAVLLSALVTACQPPTTAAGDQPGAVAASGTPPVFGQAQAEFEAAVAPAVTDTRSAVAQAAVPAVLVIQEAVQDTLAPLAPELADAPAWVGTEVATALIVRWEVSSPAAYTRKWQGIICPGGASGPTGGIGYDFGHQTRADIQKTWSTHPDVDRLASASGVVGDANCRAWRAQHTDIRIDYALASQVFAHDSLPAYRMAAERALGAGWHGLTHYAQAGNTSLGYNRGWSMRGDRNLEKRAIRDDCVPRGDIDCNAAQIRAMKRLWPDSKGLQDRRDDEARTVERTS